MRVEPPRVERALVNKVGVFCGARSGARPEYLELARQFGAGLARRGAGLVYGGSGLGIMRAVADAAHAAGSAVTGVIPHHLYEQERAAGVQGEIFIVRSMHERKALMYRLSGGFAVLPGGFGTLEELMEVATWNKLGLHDKPIVLVNCAGFFDPLLAVLDHMVAECFLAPAERAAIQVAANPDDALDLLGLMPAQVADGIGILSAQEA